MFWFWWSDSHQSLFEPDRDGWTGGFPWPVVLLRGVSLALLGVAIVLEPQLVVLAFASALIATGIIVVAMALAAAWRSWRRRPRGIRVRTLA